MAGIIPETSSEMHQDLPSFFGAMSYIRFTMSMTNLWVKHMWKACKILAYFLIATHLKIIVKRHMIIIYEKYPTSSNWYFSMTFTDFQWLFQAKCHFSRPTSNFMTFQGKIEIPWLFQACMNHGNTFWTTGHQQLTPVLNYRTLNGVKCR